MRIARVDGAGVAVEAIGVLLALVETPAIATGLPGFALGSVRAGRYASTQSADGQSDALHFRVTAPRIGVTMVVGAGIVVVAHRWRGRTGVAGAVGRSLPVGVAVARVRPDTSAMTCTATVSPAPTVKRVAGIVADTFPSRVATACVGPYARAVVTAADTPAVGQVAVRALPALVADARAADGFTCSVVAAAIVVAVPVIVVVGGVGLTVAVVIVVHGIGYPVAIDVVVLPVGDAVAVDVVVLSVGDAVTVDIGTVGRIDGIGAQKDFVEICPAVAVTVLPLQDGDGIVAIGCFLTQIRGQWGNEHRRNWFWRVVRTDRSVPTDLVLRYLPCGEAFRSDWGDFERLATG